MRLLLQWLLLSASLFVVVVVDVVVACDCGRLWLPLVFVVVMALILVLLSSSPMQQLLLLLLVVGTNCAGTRPNKTHPQPQHAQLPH